MYPAAEAMRRKDINRLRIAVLELLKICGNRSLLMDWGNDCAKVSISDAVSGGSVIPPLRAIGALCDQSGINYCYSNSPNWAHIEINFDV